MASSTTGLRFAGRTAIVTGAGAGIGAATAHRLAAEGAAVVVADIEAESAAAVATSVADGGGTAVPVAADVATEAGWSRILEAAHTCGPVSVLVSNAVTVDVAPAHETSPASWHRQLDVGLTSAFLGMRACLPDLRSQHGEAGSCRGEGREGGEREEGERAGPGRGAGSVVLVSSVHARHGIPGHPAYAAAKGGLLSLSGQLAVEYGPLVRVNTVLPGPVLTRLWDRVPEDERRASAAQTAAGRLGDPEEVAAAIAFLASAEASYVTGASLVVDGGWSVVKSSA
ncbi:SDR family NAD(P)-dependent oxidoreductase [Streptomyces iconiensis]|uniref:SDR family oxidoreductase n=1 Tax=Streptomyces iconiensis TaxID=1384038 RepID=A0ABT6ZZS9_9ACTN|nr:SDR family oxidoreductase [Streptomyces iconiensis]MDJ1134565.1 SDR family oxidoreductase [Streptomyces iconiensis]